MWGGYGTCVLAARGLFLVPVGTRRHTSWVGNPFVAGRRRDLACRAFRLWLLASLMLDDGTSANSGAFERLPEDAYSSPLQRIVLDNVARLSGVSLHDYSKQASAFALCAWLWHHARLVAAGKRLRLLCWCCDCECFTECTAEVCHAVSLAEALHWLASIIYSSKAMPVGLSTSQSSTAVDLVCSLLLVSHVHCTPVTAWPTLCVLPLQTHAQSVALLPSLMAMVLGTSLLTMRKGVSLPSRARLDKLIFCYQHR